MKHIEIPYAHERGKRYRFFEMLPGLLSWTILLLPILLSFINPTVTIFFILAYLLMWFAKSIGLNIRAVQGYRTLKLQQRLPWPQMLEELASGKVAQPDRHIPTWHYDNVKRLQENQNPIHADEIVHAIIIAAYNESREILEPTIKAVLDSNYDMKRVILVMAYEARNGARSEGPVLDLLSEYGDRFKHVMAVKHPDNIPGEVIGKGGNITYAARVLEKWLEKQRIKPLNVIVTTLDSDNRPHPNYLSALSYLYAMCPDPTNISFQPITMYTNNIWDAPAPMRVIATGSSFWNIVMSMRQHLIRNFSAHAQSMQTLIDTDYWSVRTIVEDGHQFWRTYFRYDGRHDVYPLYLPIYQDAVLSNTYRKTLKAQFIQLRRWAWGASDVAYVAEMGFFRSNRVPKLDLTLKFLRLLEGHVSWATAPLILAFAALIPAQVDPENFAAIQLPLIASRIQTIALAGILVTLFLSLKMLPPKPPRYKKHRTLLMVLQWVLLPFTTIVYNALSALYSQTRLMFGRYLDKFDVTDKAVITADKQKIL
jgi:cellulose synthase/poly-beta-1,6-N-acetylglucosamine synthase-like glycosyltransferase